MIVVSDTSPVKPYLGKLVNDAGFWLNPKLIEKILEIVKEN